MKKERKKEREKERSQCNSLVAPWILVPGDHGSNPNRGEKIFPVVFVL